MPRKKESAGRTFLKKQRGKDDIADFKTPEVPALRSGSSCSSATISIHSSVASTDSAVRTRSQAKRSLQAASLPAYQPIDVATWTQEALIAPGPEELLHLPGDYLL
jgi:hypothetical protein